jgi:uncharacterized protein DUF3455
MSTKFIAGSIAAAIVTLSGTLHAQSGIVPPNVPSDIQVDSAYKLVLSGHAIGTQNYICAPAATASGVDWFFIGPQATVFDSDGVQLLTHFLSRNPFQADALQATWQHSKDTSAVWGKKLRGSTDPTYVSPGAIEWLLLEATGSVVGPSGGVKLTGTLRIQRVNTVGGVKPPAADCTQATINTRKFVPYEADYYFYK